MDISGRYDPQPEPKKDAEDEEALEESLKPGEAPEVATSASKLIDKVDTSDKAPSPELVVNPPAAAEDKAPEEKEEAASAEKAPEL